MKRIKEYSKIFLAALVGIVSFFMAACSEEKPEACYVEVYADYLEYDQITQTRATLTGYITIQSGIITEFGFYLSNKRAELETAATGAKKVISEGNYNSFFYVATGLTPGTTYYYRAFASNGGSTFYGDIMEFTTKEPSVPVLSDLSCSNITDNSVDLSCVILDIGMEDTGINTMTYGFEYKKSGDANWISKTDGVQKADDGTFWVTLTGLSPETEYNIRAFAKNTYGNGYSNEDWITTNKKLTPEVSMDNIRDGWHEEDSDVTATGVKMSGIIENVYSEDGVVSEVGFLYGTSNNLTYASAERIVATPDKYGAGGTFTAELVNKLLPNTQYYICPYAKDEDSNGASVYGYGEVKSFTTREFESPNLGDVNAETTGINSVSVSVESLTYSGALVEYGFIWRKHIYDYYNEDLTLENCGENKIAFTPTAGEIITSFSAVIENLELDTEYYIRAYAISSYEVDGKTLQSDPGYSWGTYATTEDLNIPSVKYIESKKTTYTTFTISSGVESYDENAEITECGFIWMDYKTYEENDYELSLENCGANKLVASLDTDNNFESTITGLKVGTEYQVAAYVTVKYPNGATRTGYYQTYKYTSSLYISISVNDIGVDSFTASASAGNYYSSVDWSELGDTFEAGFCWSTKEEVDPNVIPEENRVKAELTESGSQKTFSSVISVPAESNVTYYVWAYLKYKDGIIYSSCTSATSKYIPGKEEHGNPEFKE